MSWSRRGRGIRRPREVDPPEPFEFPVADDLAPHLRCKTSSTCPHRPRTFREVPADALTGLGSATAIRGCADLLVVPSTVRSTGSGHAYVPTMVFAAGDRSCGLWVDNLAGDDISTAIPYPEIVTLDDVQFPAYRRLRIVGAHISLTLRYCPPPSAALSTLLGRVRALAAPCLLPGRSAAVHLPPQWQQILGSSLAGIEQSTVLASVSAPASGRAGRWPEAVAAVTNRELIVIREPPATAPKSAGFDWLAAPMARLTALGAEGDELCLTVAGIDQRVAVGPALVERMRRGLREGLPWTASVIPLAASRKESAIWL